MSKSILVFLLFAPLVISGKDHDTIVVRPSHRQSIGLQSYYFLDESISVSIEDILKYKERYPFLKSNESTLNFGPTSGACWIRFDYSEIDSARLFLEIANSNLNKIDFYVIDNGKVISEIKSGLSGRNSSETLKLNSWLLPLPPALNSVRSVYICVSDPRRVIIPLMVTDLDSAMRAYHKTDFLFGLYFGCLIIIGILNIFFSLYFKEKMYLFYCLHIITQILINGILKGYLFSLFGNGLFFMGPYVAGLAGISNISILLFSLGFLNVQKLSQRLFTFGLWLTALPGINVVLNLAGAFTLSALTSIYVGFVVIAYLFVIGIYAYRNQVKEARFYLAGWSFFFLGIIILGLALIGWIPVTGFTYNGAVFGLLFEVLLISAALADRINLGRLEHERDRNEKFQLIEKQRSWLEENVKARTIELTQKTKEVETQNDELKHKHEELSIAHEQLAKQQQLVENINQNLELKVHQRTMELEETVKRLIKHNHDLQQFSYIVSHNLRAPAVRIMGLLDLLKMENSDEEKELIYQYIKDSATGLDQIIHDLTQIVAIRKGLETMVEKIDIAHILKHNERDLEEEIQKAHAEINTSIIVSEFVSVKSYIQSILYNLLSNAIKYRSQERKLIIQINAYEENGKVIFIVKDNGIGIGLPESRINEIFNLYKRLHAHVPGKGLGLYLVKTQVEALNGKIEVKTIVGEGTTFKVSIPKN